MQEDKEVYGLEKKFQRYTCVAHSQWEAKLEAPSQVYSFRTREFCNGWVRQVDLFFSGEEGRLC